jgi:hypothetical protein
MVRLACEEQAMVTAVLYAKQVPHDAAPQSRPGRLTRKVYSLMDLAAIHLEQPIEEARVDGQLPTREVQPEETLTAAGYGQSPDGPPNNRYFGTNKVMDIHLTVGGDGVFAFRGQDAQGRGAHAMRGDSGGPCFREDKKGNRWLTGIISTGKIVNGTRFSAFTSTFHHRAWLQEQLNRNDKSAPSR